jgi:hypothetical protein
MPMAKHGEHKTKAELKAEAEAAMAAFMSKGGAVKQMPTVEPIAFACGNCGHAGTIGVRPGQTMKCPKCRSPLT